jgi:hypothetical protein
MQHFALCLISPAQVVDTKYTDFGAELATKRSETQSVNVWVILTVCRAPLES